MRIRKRSVALLSTASENPVAASNSTGHGDGQQAKNKKEREDFLLPLVAAVMDVQAKAQAQAKISEISEVSALPPAMGIGISEMGVRKRRAHNWRDVLGLKEGGKSDCRWDTIMSGNPEDKSKGVEHKAPTRADEEMVGLSGNCELSEPGLFEKSSKRARAQDLGMEKKRASVNGGRNVDQTMFENSKPNIKTKSENHHGGSQCKRRNGRGWQCSQWTLVGYSLCEHHLGKSRFKDINSSEGSLAKSNKGSKFKQLHLVHAASPKVELP